MKLFALQNGHSVQVDTATVSEAGATSQTKVVRTDTAITYAASNEQISSSFVLWLLQTQPKISCIPTRSAQTMRFRLLLEICSHAGFMLATAKQCSLFQRPRSWARVLMEASPVRKMRSLRHSALQCRSILDGLSRFKVPISTITLMKRSGILLTRLLTHLIVHLLYRPHTDRHLCSGFATMSSNGSLSWWQ